MSALVLGQAASIPIVIASSVILVRYLGASGFGEYAGVYAYVGMFVWLANFGMEQVVVREASKDPEHAGDTWGSAITVAMLTTAVAIVVAIAIGYLLGYRGTTVTLLFLAGFEMIALAAPRIVFVAFQVHLEQWKSVATNLTRQAVWLVAVIGLVYLHASLLQLVAVRVVIAVIETLVNIFLARKLLGRPLRVIRSRLRYLFEQGWPLAFSYLCLGIYYRIDRVLLERFVGPTELGYYAAADTVIGYFSIVPLAFMMSVFPILSRRLDDHEGFDRLASSSYRLVLFAVIGACGTMFAVSYNLIPLVFGESFLAAAPLINILLVSIIAVAYGVVMGQVLIATSLQRLLLVTNIAGAAVNLGVNLWAIPRYGAAGAAWVTVASYWIAGVLMYHFFPSARRHSAVGLKVLARVLAVGLVAFIPLKLLVQNPWAAGVAGGIVFIVGCVLTRVLQRSDLDLLKRALRRGRDEEGPPDEGDLAPESLSEEETLIEVSRLETS